MISLVVNDVVLQHFDRGAQPFLQRDSLRGVSLARGYFHRPAERTRHGEVHRSRSGIREDHFTMMIMSYVLIRDLIDRRRLNHGRGDGSHPCSATHQTINPWTDGADHLGSAWRLEAAAEIPQRRFVAGSWTAGVALIVRRVVERSFE